MITPTAVKGRKGNFFRLAYILTDYTHARVDGPTSREVELSLSHPSWSLTLTWEVKCRALRQPPR